jgi:hypothetical protein
VRNNDLPFSVREEWKKKMHPMMTGGRHLADLLPPTDKRYVGSLARSGGLPFSSVEDKRTDGDSEASEVDNLLQSVLETEDLWRLQLRALKQELLREQEEELENQLPQDETDEEKRNVGSLARSGNMPFKNGKRSVEALARAGYLPVPKQPPQSAEYPNDSNENSEELMGKRGQLGARGLKGLFHEEEGNGGDDAYLEYLHQKREGDEAGEGLDELIQELYQEGQETGKRNIGSLARGYNFPYHGVKRNLGSLARAGGFRFGGTTKKSDDDDNLDDDKRSVTSLIRNRLNPFQEGKRYIGSVMRNQGSHFGVSKKNDFETEDDAKRNIGAMARNWNLPEHFKYGKRLDDEEEGVEDMTKRYAAALLRHGSLPVGVAASSEGTEEDMTKRYAAALLRHGSLPVGVVASSEGTEEDKRHIGSLASKGSFHIQKKSSRSTGSDDAAYNNTQQVETSNKAKRSVSTSQQEENRIQATAAVQGNRTKRQAFLVPASSSDEYPMPVMQNSDLFDYEDLAELLSGGAAPEKRFLGEYSSRLQWNGRRCPKLKLAFCLTLFAHITILFNCIDHIAFVRL